MKIVLKQNRIKSKKTVFICCFLVSSVLFVALFLAVLVQLKPVFEQKASHAAKVKAVDIINQSSNSAFDGITLSQMVNITTDDTGKITAVSADSIEINKLKTKLSHALQKFTKQNDNSLIYIPVGSLTPYPAFQGWGYRIPVKIEFDGFSKIDFESEFVNAGINQVKHKIYMIASVNVSVISSAMTKSETVTTEIPVAETVIVGTVPNYYGDNLGVIGR